VFTRVPFSILTERGRIPVCHRLSLFDVGFDFALEKIDNLLPELTAQICAFVLLSVLFVKSGQLGLDWGKFQVRQTAAGAFSLFNKDIQRTRVAALQPLQVLAIIVHRLHAIGTRATNTGVQNCF
jgi:hypothetical protein